MQIFYSTFLRKSFFFFAFLISIQFSSAQIASVQNGNSITACGDSVAFKVKFQSSGSAFNLGLHLNPGIDLVSVISTVPYTLNQSNPSQPVIQLGRATTASDSLIYYVKGDCNAISSYCKVAGNNNTQNMSDSLFVNGIFKKTTQNYFLFSPCLEAISLPTDTVNWKAFYGYTGQTFYRTTILRNGGNSPFIGDFSFTDDNNSGVFIDSIKAYDASGNLIPSLQTYYSSDSGYFKGRVSAPGIAGSNYIRIVEKVRILGCITGNDGNCNIKVLFGCKGGALCSRVPLSQTANVFNGNTSLFITEGTQLDTTCYIGSSNKKYYLIKNTGNGLVKNVSLKFFISNLQYRSISANNLKIKASDSIRTIAQFDSLKAPLTNPYTPCGIAGNYFQEAYFSADKLYPGDSLMLSWQEDICCPASFDNIFIAQGSTSLNINYENDCSLPQPERDVTYTDENLRFTQLPIESNVTDLTSGAAADFCVTNEGMGLGLKLNPGATQAHIRLRLDPGFRYAPGTLRISSTVKGSVFQLQEMKETYLGTGAGNSIIFDGDTVDANFQIPDTLITDHNARLTFWGNSQVCFRLIGVCPNPLPVSTFTQEFSIVTDSTCSSTCDIPLSSQSYPVFVHCVGCEWPGAVTNGFTMKRTSLGQKDNDDNGFPDDTTNIVKADITNPGLALNRAMIGDTIESVTTATISDGESGQSPPHTYDSLGFSFRNMGYDYTLPYSSEVMMPLQTKIYLKHSTSLTWDSVDYPVSHIQFLPNPADHTLDVLKFDFSLDTLYKFGLDTSFHRFEILDDIKIYNQFHVYKDIANFAAPVKNRLNIVNHIFLTGVPLDSVTPGDINSTGTVVDKTKEFYCENYGGQLVLMGYHYTQTTMVSSDFTWPDNARNYCTKQVILGNEYNNGPETILNSFPYEYRPVEMYDSVVYVTPKGYVLDSTAFYNYAPVFNTSTNSFQTEYQSPPVNIKADKVIATPDSTIYIFYAKNYYGKLTDPTQASNVLGKIISGDEYFNSSMRFFIRPVCGQAPDSISEFYTSSTFSLKSGYTPPEKTYVLTRSNIAPNTQYLTLPKPSLSVIPADDTTQQDRRELCTKVHILKNTSQYQGADQVYMGVKSPSGRFTLDSIIDPSTNRAYPNINGVYQFGFIAGSSEKRFEVCGKYSCQGQNSDDIFVVFGHNCGALVNDLQSETCGKDSSELFINPDAAGLKDSITLSKDTVSLGDTLTYKVQLKATGQGSVYQIKVKVSFDSTLSSPVTTMKFPADSLNSNRFINVLPNQKYFDNTGHLDSIVFYLDTLKPTLTAPQADIDYLKQVSSYFLATGFHTSPAITSDSSQLNLYINFDFAILCGYRKGNVKIDITGKTFCGQLARAQSSFAPSTIKGNTLPVAFAGNDTTICGGNRAFRIGSAALPKNSYSWASIPAGFVSDSANPLISPLVTRKYIVTVKDSVHGCINVDTVLVTIAPITVNAGPDASVCAGDSVTIGTAAQSGVSYSWSSFPVSIIPPVPNPIVKPAITTTYFVTATSGSCIGKDTVVVNINPVSAFAIIPGGNPSICPGGNVTLTAALVHFVPGSGTTLSYQWTKNGTNIGGATNPSFIANASGQYTASITTSLGCVITPPAFAVTVISAPQIPNVTGPNQVCTGSTNTYSVTSVSGVNFNLLSPLPAGSTFTRTGNQFMVTFGSTGGNLLFRAINTTTGCHKDTVIFVGVSTYFGSAPSFTTYNMLCIRNGIQFVNNSSTQGKTYSWLFPGGSPASYSGYTPPAVTYSSTGQKTVSLIMTDLASSCKVQKDTIIEIKDCCPVINFSSTPTLGAADTTTIITGNGLQGAPIYYSGNYHVLGDLKFTNGSFILRPGTVFYMSTFLNGQIQDPDPTFATNLATIGTNITVDSNAALTLESATITSDSCFRMWGGIYLKPGSSFNTTPVANKQSVISDSYNGVVDLSYTGNPLVSGPINLNINSTLFKNNYFAHITVAYDDRVSHKITNSRFTSDTSTMKEPRNRVSSFRKFYTRYGIRNYNNRTSFTSNKSFTIAHDTIENAIIGISSLVSYNTHYSMAYNLFNNNFYSSVIDFSPSNSNTFVYNTVNIPPRILNTIQLNPFIFIDSTQLLNLQLPGARLPATGNAYGLVTGFNVVQKNQFTGANAVGKILPQTGVYYLANYQFDFDNNTLTNLQNGLRIFSNFIPTSTPENFISNNLFRNNQNGITFEQNPNSQIPSNSMNIKCNSFDNPGGFTSPFGIYIAPNAVLQPLGSATAPNGNSFYQLGASSQSVEYDGNNFNTFNYFKYASSTQETGNIRNGITGGTNPLIPVSIPVNQGTCKPNTNNTGITARMAANGTGPNIKAMKDSLRLKNGTFYDLKDYQSAIANYHIKAGTVSLLEKYIDSLVGQNQEAYNTLSLTAMEYYRQNGNETQAQNRKNILLANNSTDQEIIYRAKYFDVIGRIGKDTLWFKGRLNTADSTDLAAIAASGTSAWEIACILLSSVYTESKCSGFVHNQNFSTANRSMDSVVTVNNIAPDLSYLGQSVPNPASDQTAIPYQLPKDVKVATIVVNDLMMGRKVSEYNLNPEIKNSNLIINLSTYATGVYSYSLMIDGVSSPKNKTDQK